MASKPIVLIPCNRVEFEKTSAHVVKHQYIRPLIEIAGATPLLVPAIGAENMDIGALLDMADGVLLTGSPSHVAPKNYGAPQEFGNCELDLDRDSTTLPLIRAILEADKPLIAICRGFQELNVACGSTLIQRVHETPGYLDHRANKNLTVAAQYEEQRHKVTTQKGGMFEKLGLPTSFTVNSLHQQGVATPSPSLFIEGIAEDGLIEAVSVPGKRFALGTQWHPEGDFWMNDADRLIFEGFVHSLVK